MSPQPSFLSAGCLCPGTPTEKVEADHRSVYVGNVSRGSAKGLSVGTLPAALGQEYRTPNGKANSEPRGPRGGGGWGRGAAPWRERGHVPSGRPPHGRQDSGFPRETPHRASLRQRVSLLKLQLHRPNEDWGSPGTRGPSSQAPVQLSRGEAGPGPFQKKRGCGVPGGWGLSRSHRALPVPGGLRGHGRGAGGLLQPLW